MAAKDLERLLRDASRAPLGPLSFTFSASGPEAWTLSAGWPGRAPVEVRGAYDSATDALRLEREAPVSASTERVNQVAAAMPWVLDAAPIAGGGVAVRLWLRVEGLGENTLLAALGALARLESALSEAPPPQALSPPSPPPPPPPEPVVDEPRAPSWQSLAATPQPAPVHPSESPGAAAAGPLPAPGPAAPAQAAPPASPGPVPPGVSGYCHECGNPYRADHAFCVNCGARLN